MTETQDRLEERHVEAGDILEKGTVPCRTCHQPHDKRAREAGLSHRVLVSWVADNGHAYVRMSAEEVVALYDAALRQSQDIEAAARRVDEAWDVQTNAYDLTTFVPRTSLQEMYERLRALRRALDRAALAPKAEEAPR